MHTSSSLLALQASRLRQEVVQRPMLRWASCQHHPHQFFRTGAHPVAGALAATALASSWKRFLSRARIPARPHQKPSKPPDHPVAQHRGRLASGSNRSMPGRGCGGCGPSPWGGPVRGCQLQQKPRLPKMPVLTRLALPAARSRHLCSPVRPPGPTAAPPGRRAAPEQQGSGRRKHLSRRDRPAPLSHCRAALMSGDLRLLTAASAPMLCEDDTLFIVCMVCDVQ